MVLYIRMLTKNDLSQIRKVVREEVEVEAKTTRTDIEYEIKRVRIEFSLRLDKVEDYLKNIDIKNSRLEKEMQKMRKDITQIKKDINSLIGYSDENHIRLRKRIEKIEEQINLPVQ